MDRVGQHARENREEFVGRQAGQCGEVANAFVTQDTPKVLRADR